MRLGKIATFLGVLSFVCILIVDYSLASGNNLHGPLVNFVSGVFHLLNQTENVQITEASLKPMGAMDFYEIRLRELVTIISIIIAICSGVLAVIASKNESSSLWYSVAVFISFTALLKSSYIGAGIFGFICLIIIMKQRNWKLSKT